MKNFISTLFLALIMGTVVASFLGINPVAGCVTAVGASAAYSFVPKQEGIAQEAVLKELFEAELINKFRHTNSWLASVPSYDNWVGNNAIRLHEIGADPEVLIDNTIYPISTSGREDENHIISLHKYDTTNTEITDDELYGLPYDKPGSSMRQHRETLEEKTTDHGSYLCSPYEDTSVTPVLQTTGPDDGNGRKRLIAKDIATLSYRYKLLKIPMQGRGLRLSPEHHLDLLIEDKNFDQKFMNHTLGTAPPKLYGFQLYEEFYNPVYDASGQRKAFDAAPAGTDCESSVAIYMPRLAKANGTTKVYYRESHLDPEGRKSVLGFKKWFLAIPKTNLGLGAIISDKS